MMSLQPRLNDETEAVAPEITPALQNRYHHPHIIRKYR
jgi:hypothetical protein